DALLIINELARVSVFDPSTNLLLPARPEGLPFYDVTGEGQISPLDALRVINHLARDGAPNGEQPEGEFGPALLPARREKVTGPLSAFSKSDELERTIDALATDVESQLSTW
ncbi:MAG: hypothetical protein AAGJ83_15925, partial [Planctomycetota bacterium]